MKIYLVGGAVRDQLLNLPIKERDYVVVGATPEEMVKLGYRQVGKDFPVFLHPQTNEEYALARLERKVGRGYSGFTFDTSPHVTLEEDLKRRDLTINAMAKDSNGKIEDYYGGQEDLKNKLLRHVSAAFTEDPVRILRVARFAARFADLGFKVADETIDLMRNMVTSGEVNALVAERVWKEFEKALAEKHPEEFFKVLENCDALPILFPTIQLNGAGIQALKDAAKKSLKNSVRFATLLHDQSVEDIQKLCERYRVPNEYSELAVLVAKRFPNRTKIETADAVLNLLQSVDAFRRPERFDDFLQAAKVSFNEDESSLKNCFDAAKVINTQELIAAGYTGKELGEQITKKRLEAIHKLLSRKNNPS